MNFSKIYVDIHQTADPSPIIAGQFLGVIDYESSQEKCPLWMKNQYTQGLSQLTSLWVVVSLNPLSSCRKIEKCPSKSEARAAI